MSTIDSNLGLPSEEDFCKDYLLLNPKEAGFSDLLRIFYSRELQKRDFFDAPEADSLRGLRRRWVVFVSVMAQMLLLQLKKPLADLGSTLELLQNYPSSNGGLGGLLRNFLTGKVVTPDRSAATFRSIVANLDTRVDLDGRIKANDERYGAALSIMAAKLAYENEAFSRTVVTDHWQMEFLGSFNFWNDYEESYTTQAIIFEDERTSADSNLIEVAFRGTQPFEADDWRTDLDISWYDIQGVGKIHAGFMKALGLQKRKGWPKKIEQGSGGKDYAYYTKREILRNRLRENQKAKFVVTGHSLGGALAILFPAILILHEENELLERMEGVYTFGQPRVGDEQFGEFVKDKLRLYDVKYCRYVYNNDIVPRVPFDDKTLMFKHFGLCLYFNSRYRGQILEEEPNQNYFSLLSVIPKHLSAVYQLIRSFFIPFTRGMEYREGFFEIVSRMVGLVIPGLPDHGPQDYDNVARLGTLPFWHPPLKGLKQE
ncbi:triacylglycerol lipase OBL1-like [Coffea arabica]|uniref:Triacylglycerol lipase OBL1-like n=1 Tax=Coffea arabica TaxID=13443 RepID=A0A6P6ULI7_COFAR|nr:phospholipase A1-IIbeta-like [Coffea arabica]